ncbi:MAG: FAD-dependent oxidoreductase, partial [Pseudomonadales bacterium]|nr:FAD-dependent oxidoreductase [Pseudomonadales bacterium]
MTDPWDNGSFWFATLDDFEPPEPAEPLPAKVDVAIVGAGFTGLWTAWYLKQHKPEPAIAVLEATTVGFGARGR